MTLDQLNGIAPPTLISPEADNIPQFLRGISQWIVWKGEWKAAKNKYAKIPVHPVSGYKIDPLDQKNHMAFQDAWKAYSAGVGSGVGFVMTGEPVSATEEGDPLYLVALDLDNITATPASQAAAKVIYKNLSSYTEVSPSGEGLRIFVLSAHKPRSGQTVLGEIYAEKHFLTVTGHLAQKDIVENTAGIISIENEWWGAAKSTPLLGDKVASLSKQILTNLIGGSRPETSDNIERVKAALIYVDPDCSYDKWRNTIWAIMSTGWDGAEGIALEWSRRSDSHWGRDDQGAEAHEALQKLCADFDPSRGLTIGTLFHYAYAAGMPRPVAELWDSEPVKPQTPYQLLSRHQLSAIPELEWVVPGVLPDGGVAAIYGDPSSGKTFLAIDLASRISLGLGPWFNRDVEQRPVVYVALEGGRGIKKRLEAWDKANGKRSSVQTILQPFSLLADGDVKGMCNSIASHCAKGAVVFVDTLAQASPGADENTSTDMGRVLAASQQIAAEVEGLVVLIHHSGKDTSRGLRGHSSLNGAMDAVIGVSRDKTTDIRNWHVTKMKDADDGASGRFELSVEELGRDPKGEIITSCSVKNVTGLFSNKPAPKVKLGRNQKAVLSAIKSADAAGAGWNEGEMMGIAKGALTDVASKNRSTRAKEAVASLCEAGHLSLDEGKYILS